MKNNKTIKVIKRVKVIVTITILLNCLLGIAQLAMVGCGNEISHNQKLVGSNLVLVKSQ